MHSSRTCEDDDPCTINYCDPIEGCVVEKIACDDENCCTLDECVDGTCVHTPKCEDMNPCTIDVCNSECSWGKCEYELEDCCYLSTGQNNNFDTDGEPNTLGEPLVLTGSKVVPPVATVNEAEAFFWLRACDCELIYQINYEKEALAPNTVEEGAHFFGIASESEFAGVVGNLPLGPNKSGVWNFCEAGILAQDLLNGKFYVQIFFNTGHVRSQLHFIQNGPPQKKFIDSFRG